MSLSKIDDHLFVGGVGEFDPAQVDALLDLSLQRGWVMKRLEASGYPPVARLHIDQSDGFPVLKKDWEQSLRFLRHHQERGARIGIICGAGMSRSVGYATAWLVVRDGIPWDTALDRIRKHRREYRCEPAPEIARTLKEFTGQKYIPKGG